MLRSWGAVGSSEEWDERVRREQHRGRVARPRSPLRLRASVALRSRISNRYTSGNQNDRNLQKTNDRAQS